MLGAITTLGSAIIGTFTGWLQRRQKIQEAVTENKIKLAQSEQSHNHDWELRSLENAGWKDDVLFYAILTVYAWSAFDPDGAQQVFENWRKLPEWWLEVTGWMVGSVLGVKKIGEYLPGMIRDIRDAVKGK